MLVAMLERLLLLLCTGLAQIYLRVTYMRVEMGMGTG